MACKKDIHFWLDNFCWTHDPRSNPAQLPFYAYPFQREAIDWIIEHITTGRDGLIEKTRDMGATWMFIYAYQWLWQFGAAGNDFHLGSQKQEGVERIGDPKSMFWKLKYNIKKQPAFLLPAGFSFEKHLNFLRVINPVTNSAITGEANHADFGRSGRFKSILYDEFAFWEHTDKEAWGSGGDATPCRFALSTAHGKNNHFYNLRNKDVGDIDVLTLHWTKHPLKDQAWYENEKRRRSPDELAQEVDIDYSASVSNKAAESWNPTIHIVRNGRFEYDPKMPLELNCDFNIDPMCWSVSQDLGKGIAFTFKEYTEKTTITENVISKFIKDFKNHEEKLVYIYGDRSGKSGSTRSRSTDYDIIKRVLRSNGWRYVDSSFTANPSHVDRMAAANKRLCDWENGGKAFEFVHESCRKLIDSIETTQRKDDGIDKTGAEHHFDEWSYRIAKKYPVRKNEITSMARMI